MVEGFINGGWYVDGLTFETATQQLINTIANIINGQKTKSELFHDREIAIFKTGVTL